MKFKIKKVKGKKLWVVLSESEESLIGLKPLKGIWGRFTTYTKAFSRMKSLQKQDKLETSLG